MIFSFLKKKNQEVKHKYKDNDQRNLENKMLKKKKKKSENDAYCSCCCC